MAPMKRLIEKNDTVYDACIALKNEFIAIGASLLLWFALNIACYSYKPKVRSCLAQQIDDSVYIILHVDACMYPQITNVYQNVNIQTQQPRATNTQLLHINLLQSL